MKNPITQQSIVEKLGELISSPVVEHGEINGIEWAVTCVTCFDIPTYGYANDNVHYSQYNGYVLIPEGHPWHGTQAHDFGFDGGPVSYVEVHGGITFNQNNIWGFDTGHYMDGVGEQYRWNQYSVRGEVKDLARQVAQHANRHTYTI